jgi:hypothetical protein
VDSFPIEDDTLSCAAWLAILTEANSPILEDGSEAYEAAKPHAAMCLAMMQGRTRFGTAYKEVVESRNPFLFMNSGSFGGLRYFDSWADAIREWSVQYLRIIAETPAPVLWQLAAQAVTFIDDDAQGLYERAVPGYLDEQGNPVQSVLLKWFNLVDSSNATERVFSLWLSWCARFQVYPACVNVAEIGQRGTEYSFANGLRIFDNGHKARVLGAG